MIHRCAYPDDSDPAGHGNCLCDCGYPEDSFACKIRHIQINTGAAKAAND
jgi:hypothetical protein